MSKYDKYKESAFTHEEMQPMIIETDMTDIVERLRGEVPMAWGDEGFMLVDEDAILATFKEAADEIERLREENAYLQQIIKEYQRAMGFDEECTIALGEKE